MNVLQLRSSNLFVCPRPPFQYWRTVPISDLLWLVDSGNVHDYPSFHKQWPNKCNITYLICGTSSSMLTATLSGCLTLDRNDIRDVNICWLRQQIGIVSQEPVLFDASIAENVRYGALFREVSDEEIIEATKAANIHSFIDSLPQVCIFYV